MTERPEPERGGNPAADERTAGTADGDALGPLDAAPPGDEGSGGLEPGDVEPGDEAIAWSPVTGVALALLSLVGLAAALALSVDRVRMLEDPDFVPTCNFSPILSCGSVMDTDQAQVLGFPNPFLGLIGFSIMLTVSVLVAARVRLPNLVVLGAAVGSLAGAVFVHWLIFQSLYRIGVLCPWCMVVWAVTIPIALWFTLLAADHLSSPGVRLIVRSLWRWRFTLLALWYLTIGVLALIRFRDYWSTLA